MARDISTAVKSAAKARVVRPRQLVALEFDDGTVRMWNGTGDLVWDGNTYTGVGNLGKVATITESSELKSERVELALTGIPSDFIALALDKEYQGRSATIWQAFLDEDDALVVSPVVVFYGFMDQMDWAEDRGSSVITLSVEHELVAIERANESRYTDEDQKQRFPGDRGLEHVTRIQDTKIEWGP